MASVTPLFRGYNLYFGAKSSGKAKSPQKSSNTLSDDLNGHLERIAYSRTQEFRDKFKAVTDSVKTYMAEYLKTHLAEKTVVCFDLDDTVFDNVAYDVMSMVRPKPEKYTYMNWNKSGQAPAISETVELIQWLKSKQVKIFFISARKKFLERATVQHLKNIGFPPGSYEGLYLKPNDYKGDSANGYKVDCQLDIEKKYGVKVAAMIGDQQSDIEGTPGKGFLLPNAIYTVA